MFTIENVNVEEIASFGLLLHRSRKVIKKKMKDHYPTYESLNQKVIELVKSENNTLELAENEKGFAIGFINKFLSEQTKADRKHDVCKHIENLLIKMNG